MFRSYVGTTAKFKYYSKTSALCEFKANESVNSNTVLMVGES